MASLAAPATLSRAAGIRQKRVVPAVAGPRAGASRPRQLAPPAPALALPSLSLADDAKVALQQLVAAFFADAPPADGIDDDIPPEYRRDAHQGGGHGSSWVHSHIATRLATAGDDAFADS